MMDGEIYIVVEGEEDLGLTACPRKTTDGK